MRDRSREFTSELDITFGYRVFHENMLYLHLKQVTIYVYSYCITCYCLEPGDNTVQFKLKAHFSLATQSEAYECAGLMTNRESCGVNEQNEKQHNI